MHVKGARGRREKSARARHGCAAIHTYRHGFWCSWAGLGGLRMNAGGVGERRDERVSPSSFKG